MHCHHTQADLVSFYYKTSSICLIEHTLQEQTIAKYFKLLHYYDRTKKVRIFKFKEQIRSYDKKNITNYEKDKSK